MAATSSTTAAQLEQPRIKVEHPNPPCTLPEIGMVFDSFVDVERFIKDYEEAASAKFYKRDSRTIEIVRRRLKRPLKDALRYYAVTYCCVNRGRHVRAAKGLRKIGESPQMGCLGCPALIRFSVTLDGQQLSVSELILEHVHPRYEDISHPAPQKRSLNSGEGDEACTSAKKKGLRMAQPYTHQKQTVRDISATDVVVSAGVTQQQKDYNNRVQSLLDQLWSDMEGSSSILEVLTEDDGKITGIFYQDHEMKRAYASYPEYLILDATCKSNSLGIPMYVLLTEDGNGDNEIVAFFLVMSQNSENLRTLLKRFKDHNPTWGDMQVLMADKDFHERQLLEDAFQNASLQIGRNQAIQNFKQELRKDRLGLSRGQRLFCMRLFRKMEASESEEEYDENYQRLLHSELTRLIEYYQKNWHDNRHEWVEGLKASVLAFKGDHPDKLKLVSEMLRNVFKDDPPAEQVMINMKNLVQQLREERDRRAAAVIAENSMPPPADSTVWKYQQYTTPHAMKHIKRQLDESWSVKVMASVNAQSCRVMLKTGSITMSANSCPCRLYEGLDLPCSHIFAVRRFKRLPLFEKQLVGSRWTMECYKSSCRRPPQASDPFSVVSQARNPCHLLSHQEKLRQISVVTNKLAAVVADGPPEKFEGEVDSVKKLVSIFHNGSSARIIEIPEEDIYVRSGLTESGFTETSGSLYI